MTTEVSTNMAEALDAAAGAAQRRRIRAALAGRVRGPFARLLFLGLAVIASIASVDPGHHATDIQAGARYGFALLWVVVAANLIAMLFQMHSARLGIAAGTNLAEVSRDHLPRKLVWAMWIICEVAAMIVVAAGVDATRALVISQLVLSIALPVPMLALPWFASRRAVMGEFTIGWPLRISPGAGAAIVLALNFVLLFSVFGPPIPGFES